MADYRDPSQFQVVDLSRAAENDGGVAAGPEFTLSERSSAATGAGGASQSLAGKDAEGPVPTSPSLMDYKLRKFFVLRQGTFDQALQDIKTQINQKADGALKSTWLLTEIDHWNNEKERIVLICEKSLLICKYDFMVLTYQHCRRVPLNFIDRIYYGKFTFPEHSISRRDGKGVRLQWDKLREASFISRWNPWSDEIPYTTFAEHPAIAANERFTSLCKLESFKAELALAVRRAYQMEPVPGRANGALVLDHPIPIDSYVGVVSLISNQNKLGYSLARGSVGF
ncbi:tumor protein p63-regulated gene 1-like protein [Cetorhinus maximus]